MYDHDEDELLEDERDFEDEEELEELDEEELENEETLEELRVDEDGHVRPRRRRRLRSEEEYE